MCHVYKQSPVFVPVSGRMEFQTRRRGCQDDSLDRGTGSCQRILDNDRGPERTDLAQASLARSSIPTGVQVIEFNIPSIPEERNVVVQFKLVSGLALRDQLSHLALVIEAGETALHVKRGPDPVVLQHDRLSIRGS